MAKKAKTTAEEATPGTRTRRRASTGDLPPELVDQLLAVAGGGEGLTGPDGLLKKLTAALVNRAMSAEMAEHLDYEQGEAPPVGVLGGGSRSPLET